MSHFFFIQGEIFRGAGSFWLWHSDCSCMMMTWLSLVPNLVIACDLSMNWPSVALTWPSQETWQWVGHHLTITWQWIVPDFAIAFDFTMSWQGVGYHLTRTWQCISPNLWLDHDLAKPISQLNIQPCTPLLLTMLTLSIILNISILYIYCNV